MGSVVSSVFGAWPKHETKNIGYLCCDEFDYLLLLCSSVGRLVCQQDYTKATGFRGFRGFHDARMEDGSRPRLDPVNFWCGSRNFFTFTNLNIVKYEAFLTFSMDLDEKNEPHLCSWYLQASFIHYWIRFEWIKWDCWSLAEVYALLSAIHVFKLSLANGQNMKQQTKFEYSFTFAHPAQRKYNQTVGHIQYMKMCLFWLVFISWQKVQISSVNSYDDDCSLC